MADKINEDTVYENLSRLGIDPTIAGYQPPARVGSGSGADLRNGFYLMDYTAAIRSNTWLELSEKVPEFHDSLMRNQFQTNTREFEKISDDMPPIDLRSVVKKGDH